MLVKLMTEHGQKPTVVVWDAGHSGRKDMAPDYKAGRVVAARPAQGAVAGAGAAGGRVRLHQRALGRVRGRRRDRHAGRTRGARGHRRHGRDRRPRRVPADRASNVQGDGHGPRHHRHQALRPRGGDRPVRHPARADPRLLRPQGRHLGQHPRRPGHRRQDGVDAAPGVRRPGDGAGVRGQDLRRQAQGEPDQPRRRRAPVARSGHRPARRAGGAGPGRIAAARARPLAPARDVPRVRAARPAAPARGGARRRGGRGAAARGVGRGHGQARARRRPRTLARWRASSRCWRPSGPSPRRASCPASRTRGRCGSPPTPAATRCWPARRPAALPRCWRAGATSRWWRTTGRASPPPRIRPRLRRCSTTPRSRPTCWTRPGAATRCATWPRSRGWARAWRAGRTRWPSRSC